MSKYYGNFQSNVTPFFIVLFLDYFANYLNNVIAE